MIAVNGREFSGELLRSAVADAVDQGPSITLIVKEGEYYKTFAIDYHGGEKYPHLVRAKSKPDLLADIIRPRVTPAKSRAAVDRK